MKRLPVEYRPEALADIESIYLYVLEKSRNPVVAARFTDRIYDRCESVGNAPNGGASRDDLGKGIQLVPFEKKAVILYRIVGEKIHIINIFAGGRDYDAIMGSES